MSDEGKAGVRYTRTPYLIVERVPAARKDVYGSIDDTVVVQAQLLRSEQPSDTVVVAMHPIGSPGYLPIFAELARSGFHVIACATRYSTGDAPLQMENVLVDLAACVRDAKTRLKYERVLLAGWSGGGALMAGYQAESTTRVIERTAAGEPTALADTELITADGLVLMAAHRSRHQLLTDFLDASILDESQPEERDPELNLYDPANPNQPPYTSEFLQRYRTAQRDRNRRITAGVHERFADIQASGWPDDEHCFVVEGTMADPRWLDPAVDPNDRIPGTSYLGDPRMVNTGPAGLARYTTLRSWLSQWGLDTAQVDAVDAAPRIEVPVLVIANSADDACPATHPRAFFEAVTHGDKELHELKGANHYFSGQRTHLREAARLVQEWSLRHGFTAT